MKDLILQWLNSNQDKLKSISDRIWELAEVGLQEEQSAKLLAKELAEAGFEVEMGVAGMPSAFVASYGSGKPVVGILGEYDALPGLSQAAEPVRKPLRTGAAGHACGHNLLGVGALGAVLALKNALDAGEVKGTIRYYGCPAEETLVGKVFMVREGLFDDVDIAMTWHPGSLNTLWASSSLAMNSAKFKFFGRSSHAAGDPQNGRSALDAVELMNIGANYLREHVIQEARIHYVITNGGGEPNIVPPEAEVWYYVRAPKRHQVEEIYSRLLKIAEGAALMTETSFEVEFLTGCYNTLHNDVIGTVLMEKMQEVGAPGFDDHDLAFAVKLAESFPAGHRTALADRLPKPIADILRDKYLCDVVLDPYDKDEVSAGSTDVGDVSWVTPTAQFTTACNVIGTPGHSWQYAACAGMSIGHKGMMTAAKVLALAAAEFFTKPELVEKAQEEFAAKTAENPYKSPLPADASPPLHQLKH